MAHAVARPASSKALNVLAGVAVVFFIATALYWARVIFIPVALAIYFAFILTPPVLYLQRKGLPRVVAVVLVLAGSLIAFATTGLVVGRQRGRTRVPLLAPRGGARSPGRSTGWARGLRLRRSLLPPLRLAPGRRPEW